VLAAALVAVCVTYWPYVTYSPPETQTEADQETVNQQFAQMLEQIESQKEEPVPVACNRGPDVTDGFKGTVHPILKGKTKLRVTAQWTSIGTGRDRIDEHVPPPVYSLFRDLRPAQTTKTYSEKDLSVFLPDKLQSPGQVWELDSEKVASILTQFHPRPSMHLRARGRRAGPDGAFAVLHAASPDYLDILCRIHAEFVLTPKAFVWYTPAYLAGRVLVNRKTGTVDYFRLGLPTDRSLNVHLTVWMPPYGDYHDIVRVEHMELEGGDKKLLGNIKWSSSIDLADATAKLAHEFYKFNNIDWVPTTNVLTAARRQEKPILAIVSWGSFDDQSC
jgi:hypothetical protein